MLVWKSSKLTGGKKSYEPLALLVSLEELSGCLPKLKRGFAECAALAKAGSLVDVGRKERLAACWGCWGWEAALASEVTLYMRALSASVTNVSLVGSTSHLCCFDRSSGRGPSGPLCWSRIDCRRPLKLDLVPSAGGGGRGADVAAALLALRSLFSVPAVVRWSLRRTGPSVHTHQLFCSLLHAGAPSAGKGGRRAYPPNHSSPPPPNCCAGWAGCSPLCVRDRAWRSGWSWSIHGDTTSDSALADQGVSIKPSAAASPCGMPSRDPLQARGLESRLGEREHLEDAESRGCKCGSDAKKRGRTGSRRVHQAEQYLRT